MADQESEEKKKYIRETYDDVVLGKHIGVFCVAKNTSWGGQDRVEVSAKGEVKIMDPSAESTALD